MCLKMISRQQERNMQDIFIQLSCGSVCGTVKAFCACAEEVEKKMMDLINQCLDKKVLAPRLIHAAGNHENANVEVLGARPAKKSKRAWDGVSFCVSLSL